MCECGFMIRRYLTLFIIVLLLVSLFVYVREQMDPLNSNNEHWNASSVGGSIKKRFR